MSLFFRLFNKDDFFSSIPDGLFILSNDGKIMDINPRGLEILNCEANQIVGKYFSKYIEGGSIVLNNIVNSEKTLNVRSVLDSGDEIYLELSAKQNKKSGRVYVAFREVTKNYKNQNEIQDEFNKLKEIHGAKNKFFVNVYDDIVTPIDSISGFAKALLDSLGGELNEKQQKYVQIILKNAKDVNYTLVNILNYFKLESDLTRFEPKNFDIVNLIVQEVKRYEDIFNEKSLKITIDSQPLLTRNCFQDPSIMQEIISGYISLVYRKTDIGGLNVIIKNPDTEFLQKFGIDTDDTDNLKTYIEIVFEDSSPSYTYLELENIFNPYKIAQADRKYTLGTNFVYPIIKKYLDYIGGYIVVEPTGASGNKTRILFSLKSRG